VHRQLKPSQHLSSPSRVRQYLTICISTQKTTIRMPPGLSPALLSLLRPIRTQATYQKNTRTVVAIAKMATFNLPETNPPCPVRLTENITQEQLLSYPAFKTWHKMIVHSLSLQSRVQQIPLQTSRNHTSERRLVWLWREKASRIRKVPGSGYK
jgi:hypothetical protein